ncbi:MAG: OsmC family protein [Solirubrobacterales bacterium]|nr:OsmC family protein [Solirubrobacterales bacterium]
MDAGSGSERTEHRARVTWEGTKEDLRAHRVELAGEVVRGSTMPENGGDPDRADPEQLFVGALSACHMLWFIALARGRRLRVTAYADEAVGTLENGRISRVVLNPEVAFADGPGSGVLAELHHEAHERCYLAASVSFPVEVAA